MAWSRFDENYCVHPKVVRAGNAAVGLHVRAVTWSNMNATNGFVPRDICANMFADSDEQLSQNLVEVGLFEAVDGGYMIHDFLHYNPSAKQVKRDRQKARIRMRRVRSKRPNGSGNVRANISEPVRVRSGTVRYGSSESTESTEEVQTVARARGWRSVPQGEVLTEKRRLDAIRVKLPAGRVDQEWAKFADHDFAAPRSSVDRTWRNWCRTAVERLGERPMRRVEELPGRERKAPNGSRAPLAGYDGGGAVVPRSHPLQPALAVLGKTIP